MCKLTKSTIFSIRRWWQCQRKTWRFPPVARCALSHMGQDHHRHRHHHNHTCPSPTHQSQDWARKLPACSSLPQDTEAGMTNFIMTIMISMTKLMNLSSLQSLCGWGIANMPKQLPLSSSQLVDQSFIIYTTQHFKTKARNFYPLAFSFSLSSCFNS